MLKMLLRRVFGKKPPTSALLLEAAAPAPMARVVAESAIDKLSATKLARGRNESIGDIQQKLIERGYIEVKSGLHFLTDSGRKAGGEIRKNNPKAYDGHMVWPVNISL